MWYIASSYSSLQLYNLSPDSERKEFLDKLFNFMQNKGNYGIVALRLLQTCSLHLLFVTKSNVYNFAVVDQLVLTSTVCSSSECCGDVLTYNEDKLLCMRLSNPFNDQILTNSLSISWSILLLCDILFLGDSKSHGQFLRVQLISYQIHFS